MGWLADLLGGATTGLIPDEITDIYETSLPQITAPDISFKPFSISSSGLGGVKTLSDGDTRFNLSESQRALQDRMFSGANTFFDKATAGTESREKAIYDRIRAAQMPEEARQRSALEERLAAQGRLGVTTNQYGSTPEQLAMAKAQAEAQNTAMLKAIEQSQAEQAQQAALGSQFMQQGYAPQANLMSMLSAGMPVASLADVARRQQGEYELQSAIANMEGTLGQQQGLANLYGGVYSGLLGGIGSLVQGAASGAGGLLTDYIKDKII